MLFCAFTLFFFLSTKYCAYNVCLLAFFFLLFCQMNIHLNVCVRVILHLIIHAKVFRLYRHRIISQKVMKVNNVSNIDFFSKEKKRRKTLPFFKACKFICIL